MSDGQEPDRVEPDVDVLTRLARALRDGTVGASDADAAESGNGPSDATPSGATPSGATPSVDAPPVPAPRPPRTAGEPPPAPATPPAPAAPASPPPPPPGPMADRMAAARRTARRAPAGRRTGSTPAVLPPHPPPAPGAGPGPGPGAERTAAARRRPRRKRVGLLIEPPGAAGAGPPHAAPAPPATPPTSPPVRAALLPLRPLSRRAVRRPPAVPAHAVGAPSLPRPSLGVVVAGAAAVAVLVAATAVLAFRGSGGSADTVVATAELEPLVDASSVEARIADTTDGLTLQVTLDDADLPAARGYNEIWLVDESVDDPVQAGGLLPGQPADPFAPGTTVGAQPPFGGQPPALGQPPAGGQPTVGGRLDGMVSLGPARGDGTYAVPAGIDYHDFPVVDVSVEPPDGNPTHSGVSVLRGTLE